jgi:hypothetical protein
LQAGSGQVFAPLKIKVEGQFTYFSVEAWLIWRGDRPLQLATAPKPY